MNIRSLEICSGSLQSVLAASRAGADRVELCKVLSAGGVTPSLGLIQMAVSLPIQVNVLIRPREGDFLYSSYEAEEILRDIHICAAAGVNGIAVGALKHDATVDADTCRDFLKAARAHSVSTTFHRAIDRTSDIFSALDTVMSLGFDRVLTSGGCPSAYEGIDILTRMEKLTHTATGSRHTILMPGCGITPDNIREIADRTGASEFHLSASEKYPSGMSVEGGISGSDEKTICHSDQNIIFRAVQELNSL